MNIMNDNFSLRYYCLCLMSARGLRLHFSSFTLSCDAEEFFLSPFMKIYRLLRGATLMPSFSPFCTSLDGNREKGEEKSLRCEQFKTQFLHRQSAIHTMSHRRQRKE